MWPPHAATDKPQSRSIRTHGAERAERSRDRGLDALGQLLAQTYHNLYRQLGTRPSYKAVLNALPDEDSMGDDADRVLRDVGVDPQHELVLWYDHEGQERETTFKQIRERLTTVHRRHRA